MMRIMIIDGDHSHYYCPSDATILDTSEEAVVPTTRAEESDGEAAGQYYSWEE